jgi:predicted nucleic acid-binding protein
MILVDTNVLLDLTGDDPHWRKWSLEQLTDAVLEGPIAINAIVFAELAPRFSSLEALDAFVDDLGLTIEPIPREALFVAGQTFAAYRRSEGTKLNVLPDFFVGAHASFLEIPVLTRDTRRYRTYYPALELITP